jgi:hypothetical protein
VAVLAIAKVERKTDLAQILRRGAKFGLGCFGYVFTPKAPLSNLAIPGPGA